MIYLKATKKYKCYESLLRNQYFLILLVSFINFHSIAQTINFTANISWPSWSGENRLRVGRNGIWTPYICDPARCYNGTNGSYSATGITVGTLNADPALAADLGNCRPFTLQVQDAYGDGWNSSGSVTIFANGVNVGTWTVSGSGGTAIFSLPATVLQAVTWGSEGATVSSTATSCNDATLNLGSGAYRDIQLAANTYYNFSWANNTATSGFEAIVTSGGVGATSTFFNSNQTAWFSGTTAPTLRVRSLRNTCAWDVNSAVLTYRHTQPNATTVSGGGTFCTTPVTLTASGGENGTIYWQNTTNNGTSTATASTSQSVSTSGTYYFRSNNNGCWGNQGSAAVTIDSSPSASITTSSTTICHGNSVAIGGNVIATGAWTLTLDNGGGSVSGTGNSAWSISVTPSITTTYSIASLAATGCTPALSGSATITLPTAGTILAQNGDAATCVVNAGETIHFYHSSGRYIASVTAGPANLGSTTATTYLDIANQHVPACNDATYQTAVMQRHWVITPTINGTATVRLPYTSTELTSLSTESSISTSPDDLVTGQSSVVLSKYSGGTFPAAVNVDANPNNNCSVGGTTIHSNSGTGSNPVPGIGSLYSDFGIPGFSEFWLHGMDHVSPLPIVLASFNGNCENNGVHINWETASEQNSDYFTLERSRDGYEWIMVSTVSGAGTTGSTNTYEVIDNTAGEIYYRLKQTDFDGNSEYFGPIYVACSSTKNELTVFPNPSNGTFNVTVNSLDKLGEATMLVCDVSGKVIASRKVDILSGINIFHFEENGLMRGTYIVFIEGKDKTKFIPVRLIIQ
jgi:hypothetical protein